MPTYRSDDVARGMVKSKNNTESILSRRLPASQEAEKAVLSAILLNEENLTQVVDFLFSSDFYNRQNQLIYQAVLDLSQGNKRIDLVVLQDYLESKKLLEDVGGLMYLMELQEDIPAVGLIDQHAKLIKEKAVLRSLIYSAAEIISSCYEQKSGDINETLDIAEKKIFQISSRMTTQSLYRLRFFKFLVE